MKTGKIVPQILTLFVLPISIFLSSITPAGAATIKVPADQPTIQAGIDAAVNGDTVLVADGTYKGEGNKGIDFKGKAITVQSQNGPGSCIIDCEGEGRGFYFYRIFPMAENDGWYRFCLTPEQKPQFYSERRVSDYLL